MNLRAPAGAVRNRKIVGRGSGSGRGCTSGRGNNGQKSRAGYSAKIGFEGGQMPLARRVPKRGFNNTRYEKFYQTVNLRDLAAFENGDMVDYDALLERRLVNRKTGFVKLLAKGGVEKKLHVKVHRASKSAVEQIEKAGGKVELIG